MPPNSLNVHAHRKKYIFREIHENKIGVLRNGEIKINGTTLAFFKETASLVALYAQIVHLYLCAHKYIPLPKSFSKLLQFLCSLLAFIGFRSLLPASAFSLAYSHLHIFLLRLSTIAGFLFKLFFSDNHLSSIQPTQFHSWIYPSSKFLG